MTAATAVGASFGCSPREDPAAVTGTPGVRTVTVTETVVRTVERRNARAGRRVFQTACSRCHALKPGDWTGDKVNLTALQPAYETTVQKVTRGGIAMPSFAGKLSRRQIRDVAAFVSREAARRGRPTR
ncbi:MAG: cytochrome c [Actinomycetota bacterium]|nr:cytochrome c [Actinomycetota bacterium]